MGAWGTGLYASDFAADLRAVVAAVARLPLDEEGLVAAICGAEKSAADNAADEDHTVFWLVLADQFEQRGIFSARVRDAALAIIDSGKDAAMMQKLGMEPADLRKRAAKLGELRARIVGQPAGSKPRKTIQRPEPYVFEVGGVYTYPTRGGDTINPYVGAKFVPLIPDRTNLVGEIRWGLPIYGTCSPAHFRKIELEEIGVFPFDQTRLDHFFPHLAQGTTYAIHDISLANGMKITGREVAHRWRRPDGKLERIVYPPRPTIAELMGSTA